MSDPVFALWRYIDTSPSLVGLGSPAGAYVSKDELLEVLRLAGLGRKVRELECEPKGNAEHIDALSHEAGRLRMLDAEREKGRADAFLEALRLIVGVKP